MSNNTYSSKSNARRAAKKAGLDLDNVIFSEVAMTGRWQYEVKAAKRKNVHPANIRHASEIDSPCQTVWLIAEAMHAADPNCRRKDVMAACDKEGIAYFTARTQYQRWVSAKRASEATLAAAANKAAK